MNYNHLVDDSNDYVEMLLREYSYRSSKFLAQSSEITGSQVRTVYIGGGTPSILSLEQLEQLVKGLALPTELIEFTIEANPEDVSEEWVSGIKRLGIDRVSMGVQSFDDNALELIGRRHNSVTAVNAIRILQEAGLNYSLDLIYGLPEQTLDDWKRNVEILGDINPPHFSAYSLTFEHGTRLWVGLQKGRYRQTSEDVILEMYEALCDFADKNGYRHYEISNFAKPGKEALHNSSYWEGTPYLGLGPSAHSFDGIVRSYNPAGLKEYMSKLERGELPLVTEEEKEEEQLNDIVVSSMRTLEGLAADRIAVFPEYIQMEFGKNIKREIDKGNVVFENGNYRIPENLWFISDTIMTNVMI